MIYNGYGIIKTYYILGLVWIKALKLDNKQVYWFIGNRKPTAIQTITNLLSNTSPISNKELKLMTSDNSVEVVNTKEVFIENNRE